MSEQGSNAGQKKIFSIFPGYNFHKSIRQNSISVSVKQIHFLSFISRSETKLDFKIPTNSGNDCKYMFEKKYTKGDSMRIDRGSGRMQESYEFLTFVFNVKSFSHNCGSHQSDD